MATVMKPKRTITSSASTKRVITIGEAYKEFEREKNAKGIVPKTILNYWKSLKQFKEYCNFDDSTDITKIQKSLMLNWINQMQTDGLSTASINHYIRDCRAFFYWCMDDERQYLPNFKLSAVKAQETPPKAFTQADLKKLIKKPTDKDDLDFTEWRSWALTNLALDMGARASTITAIQMGDINFTNNTIYLRHTKNKKLAHQNISSGCAKALKEYINLYRQGAADDEYLFCNIGGEQLSYDALAHTFRKFCADRGVQQHNLHGLRHSFATAFAQNTNGDMVKLQRALGHSSIDMAQKYVDITNIKMGDYDEISPLESTRGENRGKPSRKIRRAS